MSLTLARDKIILYRAHPELMVRELFQVEPDEWQLDVLRCFPHSPMIAMACCKGPGKTTVMAWCAWNFLLTRRHPKIGAVSITGKNLHDNLWPEMAKWLKKSPLLDSMFEWSSERIFLRAHPETWFMSAKAYSQTARDEDLGETLAGLWADHLLFLLDECGGMPVPILRTAEAALQRKGTEGHIIVAGNTTSNAGVLYESVIRRRHLWRVFEVTADPDDPKRTPRIDIEYARRMIAEYGRDDPWVRINILARFPEQGVNQLISADEVKDAIGRHLHPHAYDWAPRILGGDIARFGDDKTVLFPRQGKAAGEPMVLRNMGNVDVAGRFGERATQWGAHSIQIDGTGGHGSGVIDILRSLDYDVLEVQFASTKCDPQFYNKRAEIWWRACEWIKDGASLPNVPSLIEGFSSATYGYKGDKILLEPKELMKARLLRSPDEEDALACTFAYPVAHHFDTRAALAMFDIPGAVGKARHDYDPLDRD